MMRRRTVELLEARPLSPSVRSLTFTTRDGPPLGHKAGQHVDLLVPTALGITFRRAYSVASAPDSQEPGRFEIAVTLVAGGPTSTGLHALLPGATLELEGPRGTFVRAEGERDRPAIFVATGTGLAPIRAILQEETRRPDGPPLALLFGCRTPADRLYDDDLRAMARVCPRLTLRTTLSRPPERWDGEVGYVQRHAAQVAAGLGVPLSVVHAYVCGLSAMVDEVVAVLGAAGVPRPQLRYELYD